MNRKIVSTVNNCVIGQIPLRKFGAPHVSQPLTRVREEFSGRGPWISLVTKDASQHIVAWGLSWA